MGTKWTVAMPLGISNLQGNLNGNILHSTIDRSQGISIWEESHEISTFIRISLHMEVSSWPRNKSRFYSTIKTPSPPKTRYA